MIILEQKDIKPIYDKIKTELDRSVWERVLRIVVAIILNQVWNAVWDRVRVRAYIQVRRQIYDNNNDKRY